MPYWRKSVSSGCVCSGRALRITGLSVATVSVVCASEVVRLPGKSARWFIAITMIVIMKIAVVMANNCRRLYTLKVLKRACSKKIIRSVITVISQCYDSL